MGDFPFHEFVQHISGKSSYEMISGIKEFYAALPEGETKPIRTDAMMTREEWIGPMFPLLKAEGVNQTQACKAFHMDHRRLKKLVLEMGGKFDEEAGGDVQDRGGGETAKP